MGIHDSLELRKPTVPLLLVPPLPLLPFPRDSNRSFYFTRSILCTNSLRTPHDPAIYITYCTLVLSSAVSGAFLVVIDRETGE